MTSNNENGALPQDEIACLAYEIYLERGCEPGRDLDDWLQAEQELSIRRIGRIGETTEPISDQEPE